MATQSVVTTWPEAERRYKLANVINECDGRVLMAAHRLLIHRSHMYRLIEQYKVWPLIRRLREKRLQKELDERNKKYRGGIYI